ncbi:VacJ family lipoprotein [Candidatus Venteria ishoeyi]|uniref:MlaA family lipoprotein n=1 Tax=Candidatus Venteria ishoeyi TaxID=1899563 RepID=UPI0025A4F9AA|nr:VacJ family lipoprotein [Candidatus Venteria ishoeyi]MDM8545037.1 VacJ family lipoprotein [Candidatus Venteria ishoeyi]
MLCILLITQGCANAPLAPIPEDPMETTNRAIYAFNEDLDRMILKPLAGIYIAAGSESFRQGIRNFFNNLDDVVVIANDLLQLKIVQASQDTGRLLLNTSVGFLGFFDPATEYGWPKHEEDFGQTLGYWGVLPGPYIVLPFFGPSNIRDTAGFIVDTYTDPRLAIQNDNTRKRVMYSTTTLKMIDKRVQLLGIERVLRSATTDPYAFVRNAYIQRREALVKDGQIDSTDDVSDADLFDDL